MHFLHTHKEKNPNKSHQIDNGMKNTIHYGLSAKTEEAQNT